MSEKIESTWWKIEELEYYRKIEHVCGNSRHNSRKEREKTVKVKCFKEFTGILVIF